MIATTRAKQQLPQKDASEPDQEEAVETASVEIQCESFSGDSPGPLGSSRTFMLFRCEPGSVTLQNWRRLEYPRPPMSKLELYLHCFADRFPGALDPWKTTKHRLPGEICALGSSRVIKRFAGSKTVLAWNLSWGTYNI